MVFKNLSNSKCNHLLNKYKHNANSLQAPLLQRCHATVSVVTFNSTIPPAQSFIINYSVLKIY